jgi:hypothetical protein
VARPSTSVKAISRTRTSRSANVAGRVRSMEKSWAIAGDPVPDGYLAPGM